MELSSATHAARSPDAGKKAPCGKQQEAKEGSSPVGFAAAEPDLLHVVTPVFRRARSVD